MTSELKCPYCSADLESTTGGWEYGCTNAECQSAGTLCGTKELWQALIQSQKDLADMEEQAEFNAIMRGKDDADEIFGLKEQIEICNKREYKLTEQIAILKQDLEIARKALEEIRDETGEDRAGFSYVVLATNMKETAEKALEQIEHKDENNE